MAWYNAQENIKSTIDSVAAQEFSDYEYLIIDGLSTDDTVNIAKSFKHRFKEKEINFTIYSEKDKGIFDAMNKGIDKAMGEWIIFMNAGDSFYSDEILSQTSTYLSDLTEDIVYGSTVVSDGIHYQLKKGSSPSDLPKSVPFYHQSVFVKRKLLIAYKFDISYKIAGDYELFVRLWKDKRKFKRIPIIVSLFDLSGVSSKNLYKSDKEVFEIKKKYAIESKSYKYIIFIEFLKGIRRAIIKKALPQIYYSEFRGWYFDKKCGDQILNL